LQIQTQLPRQTDYSAPSRAQICYPYKPWQNIFSASKQLRTLHAGNYYIQEDNKMRIQRRNFLHLAMGAGGSLILPQFARAEANALNLEAPLPPILSADDLPPTHSDPIVLKTIKGKRMLMFADSDNSGKQTYVADTPGVCLGPPRGSLRAYWDGKPAADYTMTLRQFWQLVDRTRVLPGGGETRTFTHSWGISTTVSDSMTASLGIEGGGLSASVSETFSDSVTTEKDDSEVTSRNIGAPADGMVRVWMIWKLVHEIVALDPAGKVVVAGSQRMADVQWPTNFNPDSFKCGTGSSGARVNYPASRWLFPSRILSPTQRDFPAS
jgi:hypothetical protein